MPEALPTGNAWYGFSQLGNTIYDDLLYYFSFGDVRGLVNDYDKTDLKADAAAYGDFRKRLLGIDWNERKVDAFLAFWLTWTADLPDGSEESMPFDVALKDRTVNCEEHRDIANGLLTRSGYAGDGVNLYYIPADPEEDGEGHATKIVGWNPLTTVCNWRLINHYQDGSNDWSWIRDFIKNANYYEHLVGHWEGEDFVNDYVGDGQVGEESHVGVFSKIAANLSEFMPAPKRFDASSLKKVDADYMKKFIEHRNRLLEEIKGYEKGTAEYTKAARQIKVRNMLLRRPGYDRKQIEVRS